VRRNRIRGLFWLLSPVLAIAASIWLLSPLPFALWLLLLLAMTARTAWLSRWKSNDWNTVVLYGLHSHLQQIPIFFGQLQFLLNRNRKLMEYKDVTPENLETRQP
jgi:hypothetical protein